MILLNTFDKDGKYLKAIPFPAPKDLSFTQLDGFLKSLIKDGNFEVPKNTAYISIVKEQQATDAARNAVMIPHMIVL